MKYTIFGGDGFIGSSIAKHLKQEQNEIIIPYKNDISVLDKDLGYVIYAAGITSDFKYRPHDTIEAHISYLNEILRRSNFKKFIYLSSTRIYRHSKETKENSAITLNNLKLDNLYDLTKMVGESLCYSLHNPDIKIVRLSNVIGMDKKSSNFFDNLINQARDVGQVNLKSNLESTKDYIFIEDVIKLIIKIIKDGNKNCYNVASGVNISNKYIIKLLQQEFNMMFNSNEKAKPLLSQKININRIKKEFGFKPNNPINIMKLIINKRAIP